MRSAEAVGEVKHSVSHTPEHVRGLGPPMFTCLSILSRSITPTFQLFTFYIPESSEFSALFAAVCKHMIETGAMMVFFFFQHEDQILFVTSQRADDQYGSET